MLFNCLSYSKYFLNMNSKTISIQYKDLQIYNFFNNNSKNAYSYANIIFIYYTKSSNSFVFFELLLLLNIKVCAICD